MAFTSLGLFLLCWTGIVAEVHEAEFEAFVQRFEKRYGSLEERQRRLGVFSRNYDLVEAENRKGHSYQLGITSFSDLTAEEFAELYSTPSLLEDVLPDGNRSWGDLPYLGEHIVLGDPPASVNWYQEGNVVSPPNQGRCGSCWSFAAAGAIESAWSIAGGDLEPLSEQQFVDCSTTSRGCNGGNPAQAFRFAQENDLCSARSYPYRAVQASCSSSNCDVLVPRGAVSGFKVVASRRIAGSAESLRSAVAQQPVAVAVAGSAQVFQHYRSGVIPSDACSMAIDHAVLLVGYGSQDGNDYWLIRNSWGPNWGERGFARLQRGPAGGGTCGIQRDASYPVIAPQKVIHTKKTPPLAVAGLVSLVVVGALLVISIAVAVWWKCHAKAARTPLLGDAVAVQPNAAPRAFEISGGPSAEQAWQQAPDRSGNSRASRLLKV